MGLAGVGWDNSVAENFFSHPETETYQHHDFSNHLSARTAVMEHTKSCNNRRRPHSNNQGLPPARSLAEYEN